MANNFLEPTAEKPGESLVHPKKNSVFTIYDKKIDTTACVILYNSYHKIWSVDGDCIDRYNICVTLVYAG